MLGAFTSPLRARSARHTAIPSDCSVTICIREGTPGLWFSSRRKLWREFPRRRVSSTRVTWLSSSAEIQAFAEFCTSLQLTPDEYPGVARLLELSARNPRLIRARFIPTDGGAELVAAVVSYPLTRTALRLVDAGALVTGHAIEPSMIRRSRFGARGVYLAAVVAAPGFGMQAMADAVLSVPQSAKVLFTRPSTRTGLRAARRFGFRPFSPSTKIWRRALSRDRSRSSRPRLGRYDRRARRFVNLTTRFGQAVLALGILAVAAIAGLLFLTASGSDPLGQLSTASLRAMLPPTVAASATLGGLASTIFFLTAQLRAPNVGQYGLSELFRFSRYAPILFSTVTAVAAGVGATFVLSIGAAGDWFRFLAIVSVGSLFFLLLNLLALGMRLLALLDPVSVARMFARNVKSTDAEEWGLVAFRGDPLNGGGVEFVRNRQNFGLRDPLMTIHELVLEANPQRFGQLLGVLTERLCETYALRWAMQYPDPSNWLRERVARAGILTRVHLRATKNSPQQTRRRLQQCLLLLHYLRRIHSNNEVVNVSAPQRRRIVRFVLARMIVVLAEGHPQNARSHQREIEIVLELGLAAWHHVTLDAIDTPTEDSYKPREPTDAMIAAIAALEMNGYPALATRALDVLRVAQDEAAHLDVRHASLWEEFSVSYPAHARRLDIGSERPRFVFDPW